jgi:hypothetical protein
VYHLSPIECGDLLGVMGSACVCVCEVCACVCVCVRACACVRCWSHVTFCVIPHKVMGDCELVDCRGKHVTQGY